MKIKFSKFERVAGLFVLTAILGGVAATVGVAIKKGWFETKIHLVTNLNNADGVHEGTVVQMSGLRAGSVTGVELKTNNEIMVKFDLSERFRDRVRTDSVVHVMRPFIIGEKVLDISVGSDSMQIVKEGEQLASAATFDIMDFMSGRTVGPYIESIGKMVDNLKFVAEALLEPKRAKSLIKIFDELQPLVHNAAQLTGQANGLMVEINSKKQLSTVVNNLVAMTTELNKALPAVSRDAPQLATDLTKIAHNMAILTDEVQKVMPMMKEIGPQLPHASQRALEALDETVVTLKAIQKSFLLRGSVEDVRTEEAKRQKESDKAHALEQERQPAGVTQPPSGAKESK